MARRKIHLICNAHLDPAWLWHWDEGAAEAISTFRVAADFCDKYDTFVFNHNEAILYQWIEKFEPALFVRIQRLVRDGKWKIMGGWYLQPDCNMPAGEGFIRQALVGQRYFKEKFGVVPKTAINLDPFGHTRGLVQILKKCGYSSYLICRPLKEFHGVLVDVLGYDDFKWKGFDGSEVLVHRAFQNYLSDIGKATSKIQRYIQTDYGTKNVGILLWGVGNHGGGPSEIDLIEINELMRQYDGEIELVHSTPEDYFDELRMSKEYDGLPMREKDLNPWAIGGYTSQIRVKQQYRQLESQMFLTEKMLAHAAMTGRIEYPISDLKAAEEDLLFAQFHDILPGTTIQPVEEESLRLIGHGAEILSRLKTQAFFALCDGQTKAEDGTLPIMVYNPYPYPIETIFECEFHKPHIEDVFDAPHLFGIDGEVSCQYEQTCTNNFGGRRRRLIGKAVLRPSSMNRFDCRFEKNKKKFTRQVFRSNGQIIFDNGTLYVAINTGTGLIDSYKINEKDYLLPNAFRLLVIDDDAHSIGTFSHHYRNVIGTFELMPPTEGTRYSGVIGRVLDSVRIVEEGPVRTVVETVQKYGHSFACIRFELPAVGTEMGIDICVQWNEKCRMLKLSIPSRVDGEYIGQTAFGYNCLPKDGTEAVAQKWVAAVSETDDAMITLINNGTYGSDYLNGEIRISMLRSPRYGSLIPREKSWEMYNRGYMPHIDQGERVYHFWFNAGGSRQRKRYIEREALIHHEHPYVLSFYPSGHGSRPVDGIKIDNECIVIAALKGTESGGYALRLFNPTDDVQKTAIHFPVSGLRADIELMAFEVKTWVMDSRLSSMQESDMLERVLD